VGAFKEMELALEDHLSVKLADFFRDKEGQSLDLIPDEDEKPHADISTHGMIPPKDPNKRRNFLYYEHPCWCSPDLIYRDEHKKNDAWVHKRVQ
jgi:hypothetical protein